VFEKNVTLVVFEETCILRIWKGNRRRIQKRPVRMRRMIRPGSWILVCYPFAGDLEHLKVELFKVDVFFCNCQEPSSGSGMVKAEAVGGSPTEEASVEEEEKRRLEEERKRVAQQKKHAEAILERCAKCRRTGGFAVLDEWLFGIYLSSQVAHKYHTIREVVHKFHTSSVDSLHHPSLLSGGSGTWSMR